MPLFQCLAPKIQRILVCGSRSIHDVPWVHSQITEFVRSLNLPQLPILVEGEARGVDTIAKHYALNRGWQIEPYPADWEHLGKSAGFIRNEQMIKVSDAVLVLWYGTSPGTKHDINLCVKYHKIHKVVIYTAP